VSPVIQYEVARSDPVAAPAASTGSGVAEMPSWWSVLKRTVKRFLDKGLTDWAAALTYYGVLALFPALLALVSTLGLIGHSVTQPLLDKLANSTPGPARDIVSGSLRSLEHGRGAAGVLFVAGLAGAIWSASGYVAAFMRASNSIYEVEEDRSFVKRLPTRVGVTVVLLVMLVVIGAAVTFTGPLARQVGDIIGLGSTAVSVWDIAKWPVVLLMATTMVALLYWAAPDVEHPRFAWMTPGSIVAVALWLLASAGFAIYVANFGSYNKTYGALGGVIAFLVWLWISNVAVLLGAQLNAETERRRQAGDGLASAPQSPAAPQAQTAAARRWPGREAARPADGRPR